MLIQASPCIINIKSLLGETALDVLSSWNILTNQTSEIIRLLIENASELSQDERIIKQHEWWFKPIARAVRTINLIFAKELAIDSLIEIDEKFTEMIAKRFHFKWQEKIEQSTEFELYQEYRFYLGKIEKSIPSNLYYMLMDVIQPCEIKIIQLAELEAALINTLKSTTTTPLSSVSYESLKKAKIHDFKNCTNELNTIKFYERGSYTETGTYLYEQLDYTEKFKEKLSMNSDSANILIKIKNKFLLSKNYATKLDNLIMEIFCIKDSETKENSFFPDYYLNFEIYDYKFEYPFADYLSSKKSQTIYSLTGEPSFTYYFIE